MKRLFTVLFAAALAAGGSALALAQSSPAPIVTPTPIVTVPPATPMPVVTPMPLLTPFSPPSSLPPGGPLR